MSVPSVVINLVKQASFKPTLKTVNEGLWRDALETVINRRKLTDAQANPSTQRKRYLSPI